MYIKDLYCTLEDGFKNIIFLYQGRVDFGQYYSDDTIIRYKNFFKEKDFNATQQISLLTAAKLKDIEVLEEYSAEINSAQDIVNLRNYIREKYVEYMI